MTTDKKRPRSTRTAIIALVITGLGVGVAGLSFLTKSEDQQSALINSEPSNSSVITGGGGSTQFQAGHDINVGGSINVNEAAKTPDVTLMITQQLHDSHYDPETYESGPTESTYCLSSSAQIYNATSSDIPLLIGEMESDASTFQIGMAKAHENIKFTLPEYEGEYIIGNANEDDFRTYFKFTMKKC